MNLTPCLWIWWCEHQGVDPRFQLKLMPSFPIPERWVDRVIEALSGDLCAPEIVSMFCPWNACPASENERVMLAMVVALGLPKTQSKGIGEGRERKTQRTMIMHSRLMHDSWESTLPPSTITRIFWHHTSFPAQICGVLGHQDFRNTPVQKRYHVALWVSRFEVWPKEKLAISQLSVSNDVVAWEQGKKPSI